MLKLFACASALLAIVMIGSVTAQEPARSVSIELLGTDSGVMLGGDDFHDPANPSRQGLLAVIKDWLLVEFDLPAVVRVCSEYCGFWVEMNTEAELPSTRKDRSARAPKKQTTSHIQTEIPPCWHSNRCRNLAPLIRSPATTSIEVIRKGVRVS